MKKKLVTALTLAACTATPLFAQNVKQGLMTFALLKQRQTSISTTSAAGNTGNWSQGPKYYSTKDPSTGSPYVALTTSNIVTYIAYVLRGNAAYYSLKPSLTKPAAQLVLVQGELGGFFGITRVLADTETYFSQDNVNAPLGNNGKSGATTWNVTREQMFVRLATGRHYRPVPATPETIAAKTAGLWPLGHHQPWGQIFVRDAQKGLCDNVTPFFSIKVQECYDCYYLSSFITDAQFKYKSGQINNIPPCCGEFFSDLTGVGVDRYYMSLTFDNTVNNPYLDPSDAAYVGNDPSTIYYGVTGVGRATFPGDGITPDYLPYADPIRSALGKPGPYVARFTLNGVMSYSWQLLFFNPSDVARDFIGTATYTANGYGFIGLICSYLNGTVGIAEGLVPASKCCLDSPWYSSWYGVGWNKYQGNQANLPPTTWANFFNSPVNVPTSLSLHVGYNSGYESRWQWPYANPVDPNPANPDESVLTILDLADGQSTSFIPGARWKQ